MATQLSNINDLPCDEVSIVLAIVVFKKSYGKTKHLYCNKYRLKDGRFCGHT